MDGVDTLSRAVIPYTRERRGVKWYGKLAELFLEMCPLCLQFFLHLAEMQSR